MRIGFGLPLGAPWVTPDALVLVAQHAERLGYDGLWVCQRLMYPLRPRDEHYAAPGPQWPAAFRCVLDPLIALSFLAAVTDTIRLGTAVLVMPYFTPIVLGKQLAALDILSRGRLTVGLGVGWSRDEYEAVGVSWEDRGARVDEFLACLTRIWTDEHVEFRGRFYTVARSLVEPKPVQRPHPPLLLGGYSDVTLRRAARFGTGYTAGRMTAEELAPRIAMFRALTAEAGHAPDAAPVVSRATYRLGAEEPARARRPFSGSLDQFVDDAHRFAGAGVTELFFDPSYREDTSLESVLDEMTTLAEVKAAVALPAPAPHTRLRWRYGTPRRTTVGPSAETPPRKVWTSSWSASKADR